MAGLSGRRGGCPGGHATGGADWEAGMLRAGDGDSVVLLLVVVVVWLDLALAVDVDLQAKQHCCCQACDDRGTHCWNLVLTRQMP